ncbi:hypothetical protein F2Q70_00007621 [Brassica cretica]|uniref:Pentacotripeptide-repeat region of PRORP domain-containing protein n=1 Tax=Brassica cretica TaxID=69181 RepID=A0A8S9M632_BRACR|nr:hypothetical protein F2Q70_00007621 [Brassica cretica]
MITGLCSCGRADQAFEVFERMCETGVARDAIMYNALVQGFCKESKVERGITLFNELKAFSFLQRDSGDCVKETNFVECLV